MKALTYLLRLEEPILATQTASGESNSATTSAYIPGSMVRGATLALLFNRETLDPAKTHRPYFDGTVRFLNAYPALITDVDNGDYTRLLPAPRSWRTDKYPSAETNGKVFDVAVQKKELQRPKRFSADDEPRFVKPDLSKGAAQYKLPRQQLVVHNASEDRNEKHTGKSQVYRYEALAAGEVLAGVVLGPDTVLEKLENKLKNVALLLGGSRTGGYGLARVEQVKMNEFDKWQEYPSSGHIAGETALVTLLSDVIARTPTGGFANTLDGLLGIPAAQAFVEMKVVGGFNRKWGLPLAQTLAISAGSVFVYRDVDPQTLLKQVAGGLGERQAEGFGRVAVNWQRAAELKIEEIKQSQPKAAPLTAEARAVAQRMADQQWRTQLEAALVAKVVGLSISSSLPSPAQMARVRLAARQALFTKSLTPVVEHLKSLFDEETKRPKRGAQQLSDAFVDGKSMLTWIRERAQKPELSYLSDTKRPSVAGVTAQSAPELAVEYTARLIDGVMKRAIQEKKAQQERPGGGHE